MIDQVSTAPSGLSRSRTLKALTASSHGRLDAAVTGARPFASRERYARFLAVQHGFHRDVDALYRSARLAALVPDLAGRRRLALIERDLSDLGVPAPEADARPAPDPDADLPTALGWLYVAEGSNLGAAFLLKEAAAIDLGETFGARHLAGAPEGRALHWRSFTAALDAVALDDAGETRVAEGARAAFDRVRALVRATLE